MCHHHSKNDFCLLSTSRKRLKKALFILVFGAILVIAGMIGITFLNGGHAGSNHYAKQILALFPITWKTVVAAVSGLVFYTVFFLLNTGILPVVIPVSYTHLDVYKRQTVYDLDEVLKNG